MRSNHSEMTFRRSLTFAACISLWSQFALASSSDELNTLVNLLSDRGISISTDPSALLGEKSIVVITRGQLTDMQVAVYRDHYEGKLLVLPFTAKLLDDSVISNDEKEAAREHDKLFASALTHGAMVYLYINPSHFSDSANVLSDMLTPLLADSFQDTLRDSRFAALPAEYIQQWAVSLGNAAPKYTGGYQ
jgi:hypothetical protein